MYPIICTTIKLTLQDIYVNGCGTSKDGKLLVETDSLQIRGKCLACTSTSTSVSLLFMSDHSEIDFSQ